MTRFLNQGDSRKWSSGKGLRWFTGGFSTRKSCPESSESDGPFGCSAQAGRLQADPWLL